MGATGKKAPVPCRPQYPYLTRIKKFRWVSALMGCMSVSQVLLGGGDGLVHAASTAGSSADAASLSSFIPHLSSSFAASSAQASIVAVSSTWQNDGEEEDCIVLLSRTPRGETKSSISVIHNSNDDGENTVEVMDGLRLLDSHPSSESADNDKFTVLGDAKGASAVVCMTGFVPDILHLRLVLLKHVENYCTLYSADAIPSWKLLQFISSYIDRPTRMQGMRPYGIQLLLVTAQPNDAATLRTGQQQTLALYTIDPTGVWKRAPASSTVSTFSVGRDAHAIQEILWQETQTKNSLSPREALNVCMTALIKQHLESRGTSSSPSDSDATYEGLVVWLSRKSLCQTATIDPNEILKCHEDTLTKLK